MRRVVFIEPSRVDSRQAEEYGEVTYLFERHDRRPSVVHMKEYSLALSDAFDRIGFDPEQDVFVITGSVLSLSMAFNVLDRKYGRFKVLVFAAMAGEYVLKDWDSAWIPDRRHDDAAVTSRAPAN